MFTNVPLYSVQNFGIGLEIKSTEIATNNLIGKWNAELVQICRVPALLKSSTHGQTHTMSERCYFAG